MTITAFSKFGTGAVLLGCLISCSYVDSNISPDDTQPPVASQGTELTPPISTPPNKDLCSDAQLSQIETEIKSKLGSMTTDADFSLKVESDDGRVFEYNRGSVTMNSKLESASTSKWVTGTIILSFLESAENLASSKPLTLASRPQDFVTTNWPIATTDPLYNMTLRDLLSFTSGLTNETNCLNRGDSNFENCVLEMVRANLNNGNVPGTIYYYSGIHLQVAGLMTIKARNLAKSVNNSNWQDVFDDFKTKTGLFKNSSYDLPSANNPRLAGGMHWTGNDYVEFLRKYSKGNVLSETYKNLQLSDHVGDAVIAASPANRGTGEDWRYGFGLWAECHSTVFNCQNSMETFSSAGAYGAYPFLNVKRGFYGLLARQGAVGTGFIGYQHYASVSTEMEKWATKNCSDLN